MTDSAAPAVAAIDLGATSGRVIVGWLSGPTLSMSTVHRFPNRVHESPDGLFWDVDGLWDEILHGLCLAVARFPSLCSVAVDSWAVDYVLLREGRAWGLARHYRDPRGTRGAAQVHQRLSHAELFCRNGLQELPFTTLYQLATEGRRLEQAEAIALIPDEVVRRLSGVLQCERTNASTTGLLDVRSHEWDDELIDQLGFPRRLFPSLKDPGTVVGPTRPLVSARIGKELTVRLAASHDTASAVVGTTLGGEDAAYISCGTWALIGQELSAPLVTEAARTGRFTNELGIDGTTRFLRNSMGTWLLTQTVEHWPGITHDALPELLRAAAQLDEPEHLIDVDDPVFAAPGSMTTRISDACRAAGARPPSGPVEAIRLIISSMARTHATVLDTMARLTASRLESVHLVGGGSQNALLRDLLAAHSGLPVSAGPVEATAIGNLLVQLRDLGLAGPSVSDLRSLIPRANHPTPEVTA